MKKNLRIKIDVNKFNCRFVSRIKQNQINQRKMMNNKDFLVGCYSRAENIKDTEEWIHQIMMAMVTAMMISS